MTPLIKTVEPLENYKLLIEYQNSEKKIFDVSAYLGNGIFKELLDWRMFKTVKVMFDSVEWQNGADIDPETIYNCSTPV
jgi:hypothetical protein